jgi:hypothetical protein
LLKGHSTEKYTTLTVGKALLTFTAVHESTFVPIADIRDCQLQVSYAHHKGHAAAKSGQRDNRV